MRKTRKIQLFSITLLLALLITSPKVFTASTPANAYTEQHTITVITTPPAALANLPVPQTDTSTAEKGYIETLFFDTDYFYRIVDTIQHQDGRETIQILSVPQGAQTYRTSLIQPDATHYSIRVLVYSEDDDKYVSLDAFELDANLRNTLAGAMYSSGYADFDSNPNTVEIAKTLCKGKTHDQKIDAILSYVAKTLDYDYEKAATLETTYMPIPDRTLTEKKGICFDYSALAATMLRSQGIPCRVIIGTNSDGKHAWIEVYTQAGTWIAVEPQTGIYLTEGYTGKFALYQPNRYY